MMRTLRIIILSLVLGISVTSYADSTKKERNLVRAGNTEFNKGNYAAALRLYDEALGVSPTSDAARFNRAVSLVKLSNPNDSSSTNIADAAKIYEDLGRTAKDMTIKEKAYYNLGNLAFHQQDYGKSIEYYKKVLRNNPANQQARENLRVAQLKMPDNDQNQDQNQEQQQEQQQQQQNKQQQQQQQQQMSSNAEQILQTMQNRENQTRENAKEEERPAAVRGTDKPW